MVSIVKVLNMILYFLVELSMFATIGYAGFRATNHPIGKYALGIGCALLAITVWAVWAAPRSDYRLETPYRSVFALSLFGLAALLLYTLDYPRLAIALGSAALVTEILAIVLHQN